MRYAVRRVFLAAALGATWLTAQGAAAQSPTLPVPPSAPPAGSATQVQQVREELERLKKEFEALREQYDQRMSSLEQRIDALAGSDAAPASAPPAPAASAPSSSVQAEPAQTTAPSATAQGQTTASKVFNPDIAVIGNFVGVAGRNAASDQPALLMREAEVSFRAVVDPYARADFYLSATPEGLEIEEGFLTFHTLPAGLLLKVGKMRASFGKVNTLHTHAMPTADRPLLTENLVGGEEGLSDSGVSLSTLIANPWLYLEATGEVFRAGSTVYQSTERSKLTYVGRVRAYRDLTEGANLDLGTSVAFGPTQPFGVPGEDLGPTYADLDKRLVGLDATFRYRPLRRAIYRRFQARTELVWSRQDVPTAARQDAFGFYGLGEYQFARRWYIGARYDQSERTLDAALRDTGGSLFLTFWPSEFTQIRGQYRRTSYAAGSTANEVLFQFRFGIGAHAAHAF